MTLWVFNAKTLPCHPAEATHATGSVPHIYTKGDSLSSICGGGVPGLALGLVGGGGSAGSVLRSQGTLGPVGLSRGRARGIRVSTFLCSLRPGPAAARGALLNRLRFQKQIPLNGLGLGSWLRP
jgi:hypothetical protein